MSEENYEEQIQGILTENVVTHLSMCSGYEGMGRGLRGIFPNLREIAYVEREGFACANLVAKIEEGELSEAPIFTDVKEFPYAEFRGVVDILSAGFPCQPFSSSGIRKGTEDPRHLFPFIANGVDLCRPNWVALENVEGIISCKFGGEPDTSVLKYVMGRMEEIGYEGSFTMVSASEEGAPHQRKRVFMLFRNAHPDESQRDVGDTQRTGLPSLLDGQGKKQPWRTGAWPSRPGETQYEWEEPRVIMAYPENGKDGRDTRVGEEQTESKPVSSSPTELGNPIDNGCTASEDRGSISSQQEEGRMQKSEGGCSEPRDEPRDNVPDTENSGCRGGSSTECDNREQPIHSDECQGGEVDSKAKGCSGNDGEVADPDVKGLEGYNGDSTRGISGDIGKKGSQHMGNSTSFGSCGGSENSNGLQSEVPREGLNDSISVGEIESFVGGIPDGTADQYYASAEVMALRVPRLRLLGNGIVPAQAERAYRILFAQYLK
jgi:site-specific DNA-cytosine methylase